MFITKIERIYNKIYVSHNTQVHNEYVNLISNIINNVFCGECQYNNSSIFVKYNNNTINIYNENDSDITHIILHNSSCIFHYNK